MMLTVQGIRQSPLFFKLALHNSSLTNEDLIYLINQIENHGAFLKVPYDISGASDSEDQSSMLSDFM